MAKKEWKKGFLSSGFPLEFETAKILVKQGFGFEPDYCYERIETGQTKGFSVDLHGHLFFPTSTANITASLELLIECKYRSPNKTWVFLPDVSRTVSLLHEYPVIIAVDEFSFCRIDEVPILLFDGNSPFCYKGTEISLSDGAAYDSEIRQGINQLRYALSRLISENVLHRGVCHPTDIVPFFILPILVTTAELRVLGLGTTLAQVQETHLLEAITKKVPYLILFNSFGPDFVAHARRQFKELANIGNYKNVKDIEKRLRVSGLKFYEFNLPSSIGKALAEGDELGRYCSHFLVCSFDALPEMLNRVKQATRASLRKRESF